MPILAGHDRASFDVVAYASVARPDHVTERLRALVPSWRLPPLAPGDALAIMDSGAYFVPFASSFSFPFPQPAIVTIEHGREAFEHMTALDGLPGGGPIPDSLFE